MFELKLLERGQVVIKGTFQGQNTYIFHGHNTFNAAHWEAHWRVATQTFEGDAYRAMLAYLRQYLKLSDDQLAVYLV